MPARAQSKPVYRDGVFRNPAGAPGHGMPPASVTVPFFLRRIASSLSFSDAPAPDVIANDGAFLRENSLGSVPTITWVGHSTFLVQMGHVTFLTDPTWSRTASPIAVGPRRYVKPGLRFEDLPRIDFAVVSHNHYDHMDLETLAMLAKKGTPIFVPRENAVTLREAGIHDVEELDWWEERQVKGVVVHCVPAQHWSRRGLFDENRALWSGWVVVAPDRKFYFAGDTGLFPGFAEIGARFGGIDLAAVPIGAYEPTEMMRPAHMNPEEAIEAAIALGAQKSVAMHWGTFDLTDEPVDEPPKRFRAASDRAGRGESRDWILSIGETREW